MGKSYKAPEAPDPYAQADAAAQANREAATYNNAITHGNTYSPLGSNTYTGRVDPVTGATVYDQTIRLAPQQQQLLDIQNAQDLAFGQTGNRMLGTIDETLGTPIDTSGLPQLNGLLAAGGPGVKGTIDTSGLPALSDLSGLNTEGLPELFGANDLMGARQQVQDALYNQQASYLDPQYAQKENALRTEIANKGITEGSEAWRNLMDQLARERSFDYSNARNSAITGSADELTRYADIASGNRGQLFGERSAIEGARAAAASSNRGQLFGEQTAAGNFQNSAQAQTVAEALARAQFGNQARAQGLDELYASRVQPLNEFSALRSGTQVNVPQFSAAQNSVTNPADIGGYIGQNYANQLQAWQTQQQAAGNVLNGLFGLGSAAIQYSDRRLKRDVEVIGELPNGLRLYQYEYVWGGGRRIGVMSDEVRELMPDAVTTDGAGYDMVNYAKVLRGIHA